MKTLGNIFWILFGGGILALIWGVVGLLCCCTIIGIPVGIQCFKFTSFVIWPFGRNVIFENCTTSFILNVLWILIIGWELTLISCIVGLAWCVTIFGIPFGVQCFKFAQLALMPFGARIV